MQTPTAQLVSVLINDEWDRRVRNTAARHIAEEPEAGEIKSVSHPISEHYSRYARSRAQLLAAVADTLGCVSSISTESYEKQGKRLRYHVQITGHESDIQRVDALYSVLVSTILGRVIQIDGKDTLHRRRQAFITFTDTVVSRLREIVALPSCRWLPERRTAVLHQSAA
jgi:hypothetical protein